METSVEVADIPSQARSAVVRVNCTWPGTNVAGNAVEHTVSIAPPE